MENITLSENLKKLRKEKGLTQAMFAELFAVTPQAVSKWELGTSEPDISTLVKISNFFNITINELLGVETVFEKRPSEQKSQTSTNKRALWKTIISSVLFVLTVGTLFLPFYRVYTEVYDSSFVLTKYSFLDLAFYSYTGNLTNILILIEIVIIVISFSLQLATGILELTRKKISNIYLMKNVMNYTGLIVILAIIFMMSTSGRVHSHVDPTSFLIVLCLISECVVCLTLDPKEEVWHTNEVVYPPLSLSAASIVIMMLSNPYNSYIQTMWILGTIVVLMVLVSSLFLIVTRSKKEVNKTTYIIGEIGIYVSLTFSIIFMIDSIIETEAYIASIIISIILIMYVLIHIILTVKTNQNSKK